MRYIILPLALMIAGCSTTAPVNTKFPDAPVVLLEKCPPLKTIEQENIVISDLTKSVVQNYTTYHKCSNTVDSWIEWYNQQKKIFESVK